MSGAPVHRHQPRAPELRPPGRVMRLSRMGAAHPTRLSFMRRLIRRLHAEGAAVSRPLWEMDADGYGRAVYQLSLGGDVYSLVAFSQKLAPEQRTDRVIAERWDASFVLYDGAPDAAELARLASNAPRQEAGRFAPTELVLTRANKSVRLFEHVADRLAVGAQPDPAMVGRIGYLMRTTAVYGNGKFGIADRARIETRPALAGAFQAEMLAVWLVRGFTHDLVEHVARARGGDKAAALDPALKRHLGVGNSTGLGMAPFLVSHPALLDHWMRERETALAIVRAERTATPEKIARFQTILDRARRHVAEWATDDPEQMRRIRELRVELDALALAATPDWLAGEHPWDRLAALSERWSEECQELVVALMLEPNGDLIDDLASDLPDVTPERLSPGMPLGALRRLVEDQFAWALAIDFAAPEATALFWYVSEEKLEPRLGERRDEPGAEKELPLDIARQVQALTQALALAIEAEGADQSTAMLLMRRPDLRHIVRRVQTAAHRPYSEIQDNLIAASCRPIDLLRCKLAQFGASKFDPRSDRWTRITMFQGAPTFETIQDPGVDDWCFPTLSAPPSPPCL